MINLQSRQIQLILVFKYNYYLPIFVYFKEDNKDDQLSLIKLNKIMKNDGKYKSIFRKQIYSLIILVQQIIILSIYQKTEMFTLMSLIYSAIKLLAFPIWRILEKKQFIQKYKSIIVGGNTFLQLILTFEGIFIVYEEYLLISNFLSLIIIQCLTRYRNVKLILYLYQLLRIAIKQPNIELIVLSFIWMVLLLYHESPVTQIKQQPLSSTIFDSTNRMKQSQVSTPNQEPEIEINRCSIFNILPEGIGIIQIDDKFNSNIIYTNKTAIQLLGLSESNQLINQIKKLKDLTFNENKLKTPYYKNSLSSYSSFKPQFSSQIMDDKIKLEVINKLPFFNDDELLEDPIVQEENLFIKELKKIQYILKFKIIKNEEIQLFSILQGYLENSKKNTILIEIKIFLVSVKERLILLTISDKSYREYMNKISSYNENQKSTLNYVSHEFRTPLNCILSVLNFCHDSIKVDTYKIKKQIKASIDNAEYLLSLSNDLLDLAQIRVGKFKIYKTIFQLDQLIDDCVSLFQIQAQNKNIQLFIDYEKETPKMIYSDAKRVRQVIINLLANAMKFTTEGYIKILVFTNGRNELTIAIKDTGIGIKKKDKVKLIQAFGKITSEENNQLNSQGVGLGLFISNQIISQLNDDKDQGLKIISEKNCGSTFSFIIKQDEYDFIQQVYPSVSSRRVTISKENQILLSSLQQMDRIENKKILIVDDVQFNILALKLLLQKRKIFQVDEVPSGQKAIQKLKQSTGNQDNYKVIFLDLEMPVMDGFETFKEIKKMQDEINVIGCSGYQAQEECMNCGMQGFLEKPVNQDNLDDILKRFYYNH